MKKVIYNRDNYFIGENGVYLEIQNAKEYIDNDGIKRIVIALKDQKKIDKVLNMKSEYYKKKDNLKVEFIDEIPDVL